MRLAKKIKRFIGNLLYSDRAEHTLDAASRGVQAAGFSN